MIFTEHSQDIGFIRHPTATQEASALAAFSRIWGDSIAPVSSWKYGSYRPFQGVGQQPTDTSGPSPAGDTIAMCFNASTAHSIRLNNSDLI